MLVAMRFPIWKKVRLLLPGILVLTIFVDGISCHHQANLSVDRPRRGGCVSKSKTKAGKNGPGTKQLQAASKRIDVDSMLEKPDSLWGKSADEIVDAFNDAGFQATVRQSTRGSGRARIVEISGHPEITQIQVHPGGGRHGSAYYKISTSTEGKIKIVDPDTYEPTPGEKVRIMPFKGGSGQ